MRERASITQLIIVGNTHPVYPNSSYCPQFKSKKKKGCPSPIQPYPEICLVRHGSGTWLDASDQPDAVNYCHQLANPTRSDTRLTEQPPGSDMAFCIEGPVLFHLAKSLLMHSRREERYGISSFWCKFFSLWWWVFWCSPYWHQDSSIIGLLSSEQNEVFFSKTATLSQVKDTVYISPKGLKVSPRTWHIW